MSTTSEISRLLQNTSLDLVPVTSTVNNSSVMSVPRGCLMKQFSDFIPWKNKDNLVPKQADVIINILFTGIFLPLLFLVSFSTNMVNMVVFYRHGLKERINTCLFTLSLVDALCVTMAYSFSSDVLYMFIIGKGDEVGPSGQFFIRNHLVGLYGFVTSSQLVSSVIALERCLCVTRPLLAKHFMSTKTTAVLLWTLVLVIAGGYVFVAGVRHTVVCVFDPRDNTISHTTYPTEFYFRHKFIMDIMYSFVYGLFLPGLCLTCVIVCTVVTAVQMKKLSQWRETVSSASQSLTSRDLAVTRMIVGTSVLFIGCILPSFVVRTSFFIVPDMRIGGRYENLVIVCFRFYQLASAINSTFNFFVYYVYGSKFRETTRQLFACCPGRIHDGHLTSKAF